MPEKTEQTTSEIALNRAGLTVNGATSFAERGSGWIVTGRDVTVSHQLNPVEFYRHGWQSWSMAGWERLDQTPSAIAVPGLHRQADDPALEGRTDHVGSWVGVIEDHDRSGLLLGALGMDARVSVADGSIRGSGAGEVDWFVAVGGSDNLLDEYGRLLGSTLGTRRSNPGRLWCTWYSQGRNLESTRVKELVDEVGKLSFDVFLVDDGWERAIGDWRPNEAFPEGMTPIAAEIAASGMRPGLWLAPFAVEAAQADLWKGLLVEGENGAPVLAGHNWDTLFYGIDLSNPIALGRVVEILKTAVSWGFTYLKLDFLFAGAIPGRRSSQEGREYIYRQAVETTRAALGDDVYLNACGAPVLPSIGLFDSIRVGPDVAPYWESPLYEHVRDYSAPGTRRAIATSLARLWLGEAIQVDPDVAYFRSRNNLLDASQRRHLQDLCLITGLKGTSDPPGWLDRGETDVLEAFLEQAPKVSQLDRFRFQLDGRVADFSETVDGAY
jgi:alpha-galactosidase